MGPQMYGRSLHRQTLQPGHQQGDNAIRGVALSPLGNLSFDPRLSADRSLSDRGFNRPERRHAKYSRPTLPPPCQVFTARARESAHHLKKRRGDGHLRFIQRSHCSRPNAIRSSMGQAWPLSSAMELARRYRASAQNARHCVRRSAGQRSRQGKRHTTGYDVALARYKHSPCGARLCPVTALKTHPHFLRVAIAVQIHICSPAGPRQWPVGRRILAARNALTITAPQCLYRGWQRFH